MYMGPDAAIKPSNMKATSTICTMGTYTTLTTDMSTSTSSQSGIRIQTYVHQNTAVMDTMQTMSMVRAADTKRYLMATTSIIWSTATSTTYTVTIATITAQLPW